MAIAGISPISQRLIMASEDLVALFQTIGLSEGKAKDTAKNANLSKNLEEAITEAKKQTGDISSAQGMLLYHVSSKIKPQIRHHLPFLSTVSLHDWYVYCLAICSAKMSSIFLVCGSK